MLLGYDAYLVEWQDKNVTAHLGSGRLGRVVQCTLPSKPGAFFAARLVETPSSPSFIREIDIFVRLRPHPAICKFIGFNFSPPLTISEFLVNGTLTHLLDLANKKTPAPQWTPTLKAKVVFGFAAALCHLHSYGAVHRNLTPNNVMFDEAWDVKMVDFGFAKIIETGTQMSLRLNDRSCEYRSPELIETDQFTAAVDVFSFAMIVLKIATDGAPLWDPKSTPMVIHRAVVAGKRPAIPDGLSKTLARMIPKCWHQAAEQRPTFAHILRLLRDTDEPLFPGVDATAYSEYRARVLRATNVADDEAHILQSPTVAPADRAEFAEKKAQADAGDAAAALRVGVMLERGIGTSINHEDAFQYYLRAAAQGLPFAKMNVAVCYLKGLGTAPSNAEGLRWLEEAAKEPRLPHAKYELGSLLLAARRDAAQIKRGLALLREVASIIPDAQYRIASALEEGLEGAPDYKAIRELYEKAAAGGVEAAHVDLATMHLNGQGVPRNVAEGIRILEQAAVKNVGMAMCNLGDIYTVDTYVPADIAKAKQWYQKAADIKFPHGMLKLGVLLRREAIGLSSDDSMRERVLELNREAALHLKDAAGLGNLVAMVNYGKFLIEGIGLPVNVPEAIVVLGRAVENGSDPARVLLAQVLYEGKGGIPRDPTTAVRLWEAASANGNAAARAALAKIRP